jgi:hypothetical protein
MLVTWMIWHTCLSIWFDAHLDDGLGILSMCVDLVIVDDDFDDDISISVKLTMKMTKKVTWIVTG